ncbi:MAG TPA: response regulator, partial [Verrucomicrobiae bacterium]|nr:response regulator [Verrucomicrobiae bacterium]
MKKILIIEDNQIVANVYRNKLIAEGFRAEIALDGETGLKMMRTLHPDLMLLDLMLPKMSGVEVIKTVRSEADFAKLPIIVFSNVYLTNLIQEAWKAGANKCVSKTSCSPQELLGFIRQTVGDSGLASESRSSMEDTRKRQPKIESLTDAGAQDAAFQADLRKSFVDELPAILAALRAGLQEIVSTRDEAARPGRIYELYRRVHALTGNAGIAGLMPISRMSDA